MEENNVEAYLNLTKINSKEIACLNDKNTTRENKEGNLGIQAMLRRLKTGN